jgi:hypothetical protein
MEHFISFSGTVQHTYEIRVAEMERSHLRRTGPPESNRTTLAISAGPVRQKATGPRASAAGRSPSAGISKISSLWTSAA